MDLRNCVNIFDMVQKCAKISVLYYKKGEN